MHEDCEDGSWLHCKEVGCFKHIKNHAWGRIKADGWFQMKNKDVFCPEHVPDWVENWRERNRKKDVK